MRSASNRTDSPRNASGSTRRGALQGIHRPMVPGARYLQGTCLKFYVHEHRKHRGILLYEWLLERAKKLGIHGGSAFRAIAGFGRHGVLHEDHFFELAGNLPVEVVFVVSDEEAARLLELVGQEKIRVFYVLMPAEFGVVNGE